MNREQQDLWTRIQRFPLDKEGARIQFSAKLARDNGWSREYALRVVEEYRRFVFLGMAASHPVSPSDQVDQVWHLHLMYTQDYWHDFCRETLGKPFHHGPSKGGRKESKKFENWYERTLRSYREFFDEEPPTDIWPDSRSRYEKLERFQRVNTQENWVIRKPKLRWEAATVLVIALMAVGCTTANPFDFTGPEFLGFYACLLIASMTLAAFVRKKLEGPRQGLQPPDLDAASIAYLNGGPVLAVNAALTSLVAKETVEVTKSHPVQVIPRSNDLRELSEFEVALVNAAGPNGQELKEVRNRMEPHLEQISAYLQSLGLLLPPESKVIAVLAPFAISVSPIFVGMIKIIVGLNRERPVLFLILFCIANLALGAVLFAKAPTRSRFGSAHLMALRYDSSEWNYRSASTHSLPPETLMMGVALYGLGSLADSAYSDLKHSIEPKAGSSSCGGGCGGSSDGGGGGDGGSCGGCGGCGS